VPSILSKISAINENSMSFVVYSSNKFGSKVCTEIYRCKNYVSRIRYI